MSDESKLNDLLGSVEVFDSVEAALEKYPNSYVSFAKMGNCMVCGEYQDLRCGACFDCSSKVDGEPVKGGHRLWERDNPENTWYVGT